MIRFKTIKPGIERKIPFLVREFKKRRCINCLYLFGSRAKGAVKPLSDIDIGVILNKNVSRSKATDFKLELLSKAAEILGTDEIDLIVLNEAPPDLTFNILRDGKILFCRSRKDFFDFREAAISNYLDSRHLRDETSFHLNERIKKGRYAYD